MCVYLLWICEPKCTLAEREDSVGSPHSRSEWTEQKSYELKINGREFFILRNRENHRKNEQSLRPPGIWAAVSACAPQGHQEGSEAEAGSRPGETMSPHFPSLMRRSINVHIQKPPQMSCIYTFTYYGAIVSKGRKWEKKKSLFFHTGLINMSS